MDVKILGTGCSNCRALEAATREALENAGSDSPVEKVEEMSEIMSYGVMGLPALVVDGQVVVSGQVPEASELEQLLGVDS